MRDVDSLGRQHELGVGRDIYLSHAGAGVRYRDAADLGIVFSRDEHLHGRLERSVAARELGAILIESDIVVVGLAAARLKSSGPYVAAADVTQKNIRAPSVAGGVLAPTSHSQIAPAAVTRAGGREHHRIAAVREKLGDGRRAVRCGEPPSAGWFHVQDFGG